MYVMRARITYILTALGLTAATLGYAVPYTPTEALNGAMTDVVVALNEHGVIRLRPEIGLPPSTLVEFAAALGRARSGQECGFIASVPACSRIPGVTIGEHAGAPLAPDGAAFALSNVHHDDVDALGIAPMYRSIEAWEGSGAVGADANLAAVWHQDDQFRERPAAISLLYCVATPPPGVADTTYADTRAAFAMLPEALRARLCTDDGTRYREAMHSLNTVDGVGDGTAKGYWHPLVLDSSLGPSLYLGSRNAQVAGLGEAESQELLDALIVHTTTAAAPLYAHAHERGGLLISCNRMALHTATLGQARRATGRADARHLIRVLVEEPTPLSRWAAVPG